MAASRREYETAVEKRKRLTKWLWLQGGGLGKNETRWDRAGWDVSRFTKALSAALATRENPRAHGSSSGCTDEYEGVAISSSNGR